MSLKLESIKLAIEAILISHGTEGISEYELIKRLQNAPYALLEPDACRAPLGLFQTHFVVFHCLYSLREQMLIEHQGWLFISALKIELQPWYQGQVGIEQHDPLQSYYLDWQNFRQTGEQEVNAMLDDFWKRMAGQTSSVSEAEKALALQDMELDELVSLAQLKRQYRRLLHLYHPDKGGEHEHCVRIEQAYWLLKRALV